MLTRSFILLLSKLIVFKVPSQYFGFFCGQKACVWCFHKNVISTSVITELSFSFIVIQYSINSLCTVTQKSVIFLTMLHIQSKPDVWLLGQICSEVGQVNLPQTHKAVHQKLIAYTTLGISSDLTWEGYKQRWLYSTNIARSN